MISGTALLQLKELGNRRGGCAGEGKHGPTEGKAEEVLFPPPTYPLAFTWAILARMREKSEMQAAHCRPGGADI